MELNTNIEIVQVENLLVEKDVLGIIEKIQEYDPNLRVMYLDPDKAEFCDAPWIIAELCPDGLLRKVFEVWELNDTVLTRVIMADNRRRNILDDIERHNVSQREATQRRFQEEREEMKDVFKTVFSSPKGRYSFPNSQGQVVVLDDSIGIVKKDGRSTI